MLKKIMVTSMLLLFLGPLLLTGPVLAETEPTGKTNQTIDILEPLASAAHDKTAENLFLSETDLAMQGVTHRHEFYFAIPSTRRVVDGSYLELFYSHSSVLKGDRSTITVMLDDVPLGSRFLDQNSAKQSSWRHDLNHLNLGPGFHKLTILLHMEVTDNVCMDQNNPANWFVLNKESVIHLRYEHQYERSNLASYPAPFIEQGSQNPYNTLLVVPDEPTPNEWKSLGMLSRFFASLASEADLRVIREADIPGADDLIRSRHLVFIGALSSWKDAGAASVIQAVNTMGKESAAGGFVHTGPSAWNSNYDMLIITGDDDGILKAARLLTDEQGYRQLSGSSATAASYRLVEVKSVGHHDEGSIALSELGYDPLVIEGHMGGSARISFKIPPEWDVSRGGKVTLRFSHAETVHLAHAQVTLRINDIPVASSELSKESSQFGTLVADIPPAALKGDYIVADISFRFAPSRDECADIAQIENWAVVHGDSSFRFSRSPNRTLNLGLLPYPFVKNGVWQQTTWLVPEAPTAEELSLFAMMHALLGGNVHFDHQLRVIPIPRSIHGDEEWKDNNLIVTSLASKLPRWLAGTDTAIPLAYSEQGWQAVNDQIPLTDSLRQRSVVMQLFPSSLHPEADVLVVAGSTDEDLKRLRTAMIRHKWGESLDGQVVVWDERARHHTFHTGQYEREHSVWYNALDDLIMENKPVLQRVIMIAVILVVLAVFALIVWWASRHKFRT